MIELIINNKLQISYQLIKCLNRQIMKGEANHNEKQLQFQFDLQIQKIKLLNTISIPKNSYLEVIWRRGQKNISTKIKPQIKGSEQQIFFCETLSMISTCALNLDNMQFSPKQSMVSATIFISGSQKLFGSVTINLSSVLNSKNYYERGVKLIEEELNGRAKSKIFMKLSSNYLKQKMKGDQQSIGSGVNSHSYNNTSTYSIQRRLVDIPSKDTYSVLSYGGAVRYSNRKQDTASIRREDSSKKIQQQSSKQYGRYGTYTQQNFYTKPTNQYNLMQNNAQTGPIQGITAQGSSNIKSISSIQSSANRIQRNSESQNNNRSVAGEQSSRLLIEQQTKRSKLQAEVTKNKVQNEELKNKLTQYVRQNMKIKQQLKKFYENSDSKQAETKKQNDELKQRNYLLVNEVRQLKNRFEKYVGLERQCQSLKIEKQNSLREAKRHEDLSNHFQRQTEQLRSQLTRSKQNETRLANQLRQMKSSKVELQQNKRKQIENKVKQLNGQLDYYQNSCKNLSVLLRESEDKNRNFEREIKSQEGKVQMVKSEENRKFNDLVYNKQRQIRELNEKLNQKNQQCTKYIVEAQKFKNEYGKVKDERIAQLQNNRIKQATQIDRLNANLKQLNIKAEQLQNEKNTLNAQIRGQLIQRSKQAEKLKQIQQTLIQNQKKYQKQIGDLRRTSHQLQVQNLQLNKLVSEKTRSLQQASCSREQLQQLMKQNLQLQLQIKYKNQQCLKLSRVQQDLQNIKCKLVIQEGNNRQLNEAYEKCQKQLKQKNRAYILECQKSKMLVQERVGFNKGYNQVKEELERAKIIMDNGQRQFQDMKVCIQDLQTRNVALVQEIRSLQSKLSSTNTQKYTTQIRTLQSRIRQLQSRDIQKIKSIQNLHKSLSTSSKQIKQLQSLSEQRYQKLSQKQKQINDLQQKIRDLEADRISIQNQLQSAIQERKNLSKKNQMIMEELFSYKKRFEEERGRSTSTLHVRNSEDYVKIKSLENELQKKDDKIRKMQKQMIALQNQNVNLSIQVMKKLEDMTPK